LKVILVEDMMTLGSAGTVVEVAKGYARNYLIPQGKAMEATAGNLARIHQTQAKLAQAQARAEESARAQAALLEGLVISIAQRVGEEERLYGSVTVAMIAEALAAKGFEVDRKDLELAEPIKKLGNYEVAVRLAPGVKARVNVEVVPESA
jgi:large subunit ribosomal protein L9